MNTRDRWLDEGLVVLAEQGPRGVRVDRIAARLALTKGSFHHHFKGINDYHRALLQRFEADSMDALRAAVGAVAGLPPEQALMELPSHVSFDPRLEAAVCGRSRARRHARSSPGWTGRAWTRWSGCGSRRSARRNPPTVPRWYPTW